MLRAILSHEQKFVLYKWCTMTTCPDSLFCFGKRTFIISKKLNSCIKINCFTVINAVLFIVIVSDIVELVADMNLSYRTKTVTGCEWLLSDGYVDRVQAAAGALRSRLSVL